VFRTKSSSAAMPRQTSGRAAAAQHASDAREEAGTEAGPAHDNALPENASGDPSISRPIRVYADGTSSSAARLL
jgi:hypothetical protein